MEQFRQPCTFAGKHGVQLERAVKVSGSNTNFAFRQVNSMSYLTTIIFGLTILSTPIVEPSFEWEEHIFGRIYVESRRGYLRKLELIVTDDGMQITPNYNQAFNIEADGRNSSYQTLQGLKYNGVSSYSVIETKDHQYVLFKVITNQANPIVCYVVDGHADFWGEKGEFRLCDDLPIGNSGLKWAEIAEPNPTLYTIHKVIISILQWIKMLFLG